MSEQPATGQRGLWAAFQQARARIVAWVTPNRRRWLWRGLTLLSLLLVAISSVYAVRELARSDVQLSPGWLGVALLIYTVNYTLHTLGWHLLARRFCGVHSLRANTEAVAASNLVKYLPTVAWYIANRADFYARRGVAVHAVVAASLLELAFMLGSGTVFLLLFWFSSYGWSLGLLSFAAVIVGLLVVAVPDGIARRWWRRRVTTHAVAAPSSTVGRVWLLLALLCYAVTWLTGVAFLAAIVAAFAPVTAATLLSLAITWLFTGVASFVVSLTLGTIGIAREITLVVLLTQAYPLAVAVATGILVKLLLTVGEIIVSGAVLAVLRVTPTPPPESEA